MREYFDHFEAELAYGLFKVGFQKFIVLPDIKVHLKTSVHYVMHFENVLYSSVLHIPQVFPWYRAISELDLVYKTSVLLRSIKFLVRLPRTYSCH